MLFNAEEITNSGTVNLAGGEYGYLEEEEYPAAKDGVLLLINSFEPYIAWNLPPDLTYGQALSGDQLNAASDVAGTFEYDPPLETHFLAGAYVLKAVFSPADPDKYQEQTLYRSVMVHRAPLTVSLHKQERVWGYDNPELSYDLSGWQLGDSLENVVFGVNPFTLAENESPPADYVISATHNTPKN